MKTFFQLLLVILSVTLSSCWRQIGELTSVSTRNVDSKAEYKLIEKYVEGKAKTKTGRAMENAIDNAVKKCDGESMRNVKIYVKRNGRKVKVIGDVWGLQSVSRQVNKSVSADIKFKVGDWVMFKDKRGKIREGQIFGINESTAIVEYVKQHNYILIQFPVWKKTQLYYEQLTKFQKKY